MKFYSKYYENCESLLESPNLYIDIFKNNQIPGYNENILKKYENAISFLLFTSLNKRNMEINKNLIENNDIEQLKSILLNQDQQKNKKINLIFEFLFGVIKNNKPYYFDQSINEILNVPFFSLFEKSSKIYSKLLFPNEHDNPTQDIPEDLFEFQEMEDFYSNSPKYLQMINLIGEIIKKSVQDNLFKKQVIKIIEIGSGTGTTSKAILDTINEIFKNFKKSVGESGANGANKDNNEIILEIEFTYSDVNPTLIKKAKQKLKHYNDSNLKVVFRNLNIEKSLIDQGLNKNYYDVVVIENVLHFIKDIEFSLKQIYSILKPNGHFILSEPPYKSVVLDSVYGCLYYWWDCYGDYRVDRCILPQENWLDLLKKYNFKDLIFSNNYESLPYLIQCRKHVNTSPEISLSELFNLDQIIFYGNGNSNQFQNLLYQLNLNCEFINMNQVNQFNYTQLKEKSIIFNIKTSNSDLSINELDQEINEYNIINQSLLNNNNFKTKHIIISTLSTKECNNYINSSIIGLMGYWLNKNKNLKLYNLDFDLKSLNIKTFINCIYYMNNCGGNQFIIRNNSIYHESLKMENNLILNHIKLNDNIILIGNLNNNNIYNNLINIDSNNFDEDLFLDQCNTHCLTLIFRNQDNIFKNLNQIINKLKVLIKINNLSIENKINLNQIIIQTVYNHNQESFIINSLLESFSNNRIHNNQNSIYINYQGQPPNIKNDNFYYYTSSYKALNLFNFNCFSNLDYSSKIKLKFYLNEKYPSSNVKNHILSIINKVFDYDQVELDFNKSIMENFNLSSSSSCKFNDIKDYIDNEILQGSIDLDQIKCLSINSIINIVYNNQLKLFEFFRKKTK